MTGRESQGPATGSKKCSAASLRETLAYEVVLRFYPGAGQEAMEFARSVSLPEQAVSIHVNRIVVPDGEERVVQFAIGRST